MACMVEAARYRAGGCKGELFVAKAGRSLGATKWFAGSLPSFIVGIGATETESREFLVNNVVW